MTASPVKPKLRQALASSLWLGVVSVLVAWSQPAQAWEHHHPGSLHTIADAWFVTLVQGLPGPTNVAYQDMLRESEEALGRPIDPAPAEFYVPGHGSDPEGHGLALGKLQSNAMDAYLCALRWYVGPELHNGHHRSEYRQKAIDLIMAWSATTSSGLEDTGLVLTYFGANFLLAADILLAEGAWDGYADFEWWISNVFHEEAWNQTQFSIWWAPNGNNHNSWGIYGLLLYAHVVEDDALFDQYAEMLREHILGTIDANGAMPGELIRSEGRGFWYTYFALAPVTAAARIVRNVTYMAVDPFALSTEHGRRLRRALHFFYHFNSHPSEITGYHGPNRYGIEPIQRDLATVGPLFEAMAGEYGGSQEFSDYIDSARPVHSAYAAWPRATVFPQINTPPAGKERLRPHVFDDGWNDFVPASGDWAVVAEHPATNNRVYRQASTSASNARSIVGSTEWLNYKLSARVRALGFNSNSLSGVGLMVRYTDVNNYYTAHYYRNTGRLRIEQKSNGVLREVASVPFNFQMGRWYTMDLVAEGPHIKFYVDGTLMLEDDNYQDPGAEHPLLRADFSLWSGKAGLFAHRTNAQFDNVTLTKVPLDLRFQNLGRHPTYHCVELNEEADEAGTWLDNYLCMNQDIGLAWSNAGRIEGMRCEAISEAAEPDETTWADNFVCVPEASPYRFQWSSAGPIAGKTCARWHEPSDPHTWHDNYLCY